MRLISKSDVPARTTSTWQAGLLDKLIHPLRHPSQEQDDPGRPFTPPPPQPSKDEDDDDKNGPRFPMDPVPA